MRLLPLLLLTLALLLAVSLLALREKPLTDNEIAGISQRAEQANTIGPVQGAQTLGDRLPPEAGTREVVVGSTAWGSQGLARTGLIVAVVDDLSAPIVGASVTASWGESEHERTTDFAGRCILPLTGQEPSLTLSVSAEGHLSSKREFMVVPELEVRLPRLGTLRGLVVDAADDRPVVGAQALSGVSESTSGPDGRFEVLVPVGYSIYVSVTADGYAHDGELILVRDPSQQTEVVFRLNRSHPVTVRVVDSQDGHPIPGASIYPHDVESASDGSVMLGIPPQVFYAEADGYCRSFGGITASAGRMRQIPLVRGAFVHGIVRDKGGSPVPGAQVSFSEDGLQKTLREAGRTDRERLVPAGWTIREGGIVDTEVADADGQFQSRPLIPMVTYSIRVSATGYTTRTLKASMLGPGNFTVLDVVIEKEPTIPWACWRGVMRLNGEPIGGSIRWRVGERAGGMKVGDDGHFETTRIAPGTVAITPRPADLTGQEFSDLLDGSIRITILPGQHLDKDLDLELPLGAISGRVRTVAGDPAVDVTVQAHVGEPYWIIRDITDADGTFRLDVPDVGLLYDVSVNRGGAGDEVRGVAPGTDGIELTLPDVAMLRIRVREDPQGEPIKDWILLCRRSANQLMLEPLKRGLQVPDVEGWFEIPRAAGSLEVLVQHARGWPTILRHLTLGNGEVKEMDLVLPHVMNVTLTLAEGSSFPGDGQVWLVPPKHAEELMVILKRHGTRRWHPLWTNTLAGASARPVQFAGEGGAGVQGLAEGTYQFVVYPPDYDVIPLELQVRATAENVHEVRFRAKQ